jgi:hypothetical protein
MFVQRMELSQAMVLAGAVAGSGGRIDGGILRWSESMAVGPSLYLHVETRYMIPPQGPG